MKNVWTWIQAAIAMAGGALGWFLGPVDGVMYALIAFVILDYITGVICAIFDKKLSSDIGARGILKKVLIFIIVGVGHILDSQVLNNGGVLRTAVILFYLSNEGISILENSARAGLPLPQKLKDVLAQLHGSKQTGGKT